MATAVQKDKDKVLPHVLCLEQQVDQHMEFDRSDLRIPLFLRPYISRADQVRIDDLGNLRQQRSIKISIPWRAEQSGRKVSPEGRSRCGKQSIALFSPHVLKRICRKAEGKDQYRSVDLMIPEKGFFVFLATGYVPVWMLIAQPRGDYRGKMDHEKTLGKAQKRLT